MAKYWQPGQVKTRLGRQIGLSAAAALHRSFVLHLQRQLADVDALRVMAIAPDDRCAAAQRESLAAWRVVPQGVGDLGDRLLRFFCDQLTCCEQVLVIGADCPLIDPPVIEQTWQQLERHDAVLGPAIDGGYYLLGLRRPWQPWMINLFVEMPWGTDRVAAVTRQRLQAAGRRCGELVPREDVDTLPCLLRLRDQLHQHRSAPALYRAVQRALAP